MSGQQAIRRAPLLAAIWLSLAVGAASLASASASAFDLTGFDGTFAAKDGSPTTQALSHPYEAIASFDVNTVQRPNGEVVPEQNIKDIDVALPPGLIGDPTATPQCSLRELAGVEGLAECSPDAQVGVATLRLGLLGSIIDDNFGLFNIRPRPGAPAEFGFNLLSVPVLIKARVRTGGDYGFNLVQSSIPQGLSLAGATLRFWGVPGDPAHTRERGFDKNSLDCSTPGSDAASCNHEFGAPIRPFLTMPAVCSSEPLQVSLHMDSWQDPGRDHAASFLTHDNSVPPNPVGIDGCDDPRLSFQPTLRIAPTTTRASSVSGLDIDLRLPTNTGPVAAATDLYSDSESPAAVAAPPLRAAVVKLPAGLAVNPAVASGLSACTRAEIELSGPAPPRCPDASKIGTVEVLTPLLDHPLNGGIYIARQGDNEFGTLLAAYIGLHDPATGVVVKLAGRIDVDQATGQLTASFDHAPQLPISDLRLSFFGGNGGVFITPEACGTYTTNGEFSSWSVSDTERPAAETATATAPFTIDQGPNGEACANGAFDPSLSAGTTVPTAGRFSPLVLRVSRGDGTAQLSSVAVKLPKGILAKLAGVPYCPETASAAISTSEGAAAAEVAAPSCPQASQIGTVAVGVGAGNPLLISSGRAYLAGPYKGAPLSLMVVVPALAGPFDLGNVVVRVALQIDPETARINAVSDPLPTILHGIPLDLRSIAVNLDRPQFIVNPTSCEAMAVEATLTSPRGASASRSQRFQVGGCRALSLAPKLSLKLHGGTKRAAHPALRAVLDNPTGAAYTNVQSASVTLPGTEILEQSHLSNVCTQVQFAADQCPAGSVYGFAKAVSPLLERPLEGPVYLRSNGGKRPLPDLVADLRGQIHVVLVGAIDSVHQRLRTKFFGIPDAPVSQFVLSLKGGRKGLLANTTSLCAKVSRASVKIAGQDGIVSTLRPRVSSGCRKSRGHG